MTTGSFVALLFLWTNPALNVDGTPCTDLDVLRLRGMREATGDTLSFPKHRCYRDEDDVEICGPGPGAADSMHVTMVSVPGEDWWQFNVFAADSTGNESGPSNTVRLDLGNYGPITGVGDPGFEPGPEGVERWFDVHGRLIDKPRASGVYFRQIGRRVWKIVLLK